MKSIPELFIFSWKSEASKNFLKRNISEYVYIVTNSPKSLITRRIYYTTILWYFKLWHGLESVMVAKTQRLEI